MIQESRRESFSEVQLVEGDEITIEELEEEKK
jgi:hypothetical protein